ncbi:hypothetical protein K1T71_003995 [Dendrolimus kikuchii]|uniref:Uncharacterized protein n=1 Tax=Dendrolimus kikuchii TaxID=765133 RepID=A0ACC1D9X9_9NEOP|nr:hypothetical protein K1T71_003995 [Dendrolimus kikuchii]
MSSNNTLSTYILKLSNPLKEIRERALKILTAKLRLGWELEDELASTRELLEALLEWFNVENPALQKEALDLLLASIKTKAGTYVIKDFGIKRLLSSLNKIISKLDDDAKEVYQDLVDTLKFINTVESADNITIPRLHLSELNSEVSGGSSDNQHYMNNFSSSKDTPVSDYDHNCENHSKTSDGIKLLLFPWTELCLSDLKTMLLIEDALKLLKSTRRCCRFICDVFLRDFPPEIFLNRPEIVKTLVTISEGNQGGRPIEALLVLLCLTQTLYRRVLELSSLDLIHETQPVLTENKGSEDRINEELENIAGVEGAFRTSRYDDGIAALKQLPAPLYALDTLQMILSVMTRNVILVDTLDKSEILSLKEINVCLCLVDSLIQLLLGCVTVDFWNMDHSQKIYKDIAHKSNVVMRAMGELLIKYRKSFFEDTARIHHRVAWLHLVFCSERLLKWSRDSAMPPTSLITAMQAALLDPALEMFYPEITKGLANILQNSRLTIEQEFKSKYRELKQIFSSMEDANKFVKNKNNIRRSKTVFSCIKNSLPVLEIFQNEKLLNDIADILLSKTKDFDMNDNDWSIVRNITVCLMAHNTVWVQASFYKKLSEMVKAILISDDVNESYNEKCLTLLCDVSILTELCCHGLSSKYKEVEDSASEILLYLLKGRLVLSETCWWKLLASLLPVLPLIHVYAAHETHIGQAICKTLELDIADCLGISLGDTTAGLVRLLFVRCVAVQLESAHFLCRLLDDERYMPPKDLLRADVLLNSLRRVQPQDFNIDNSSPMNRTPQTSGLIQILEVLKQDIVLADDGLEFVSRVTAQPLLEPSLRRSTLQQLAVILRQQELHETFLQCDGLKVIIALLRMSLTVDDYLAFPECAISCISVLNSVCFVSRHSLSKVPDLLPLLIRAILVFPANESAVLMAAQILALVAWAGFVLQELDESRHRVPALPLCVTERTSLPFNVNSYWKTSTNSEHSYIEWLLSEEEWRAAVRVRWWCVSCEGSRSLSSPHIPTAPLALQPCKRDVVALKASDPLRGCTKALLALENATSHSQVNDALSTLESYIHLLPASTINIKEFSALPWHHTRRFLCAPPASTRDTALLVTLLNFLKTYMDTVLSDDGITMTWIESYFVGNNAAIISLLGRDQLYQQQTTADTIEITQLNIQIVKIVLRCVNNLDRCDNYDNKRMESLLKILLACLDRINLKNFHMLGYLNELLRCIKFILHLRYSKLSEETLIVCLKVITKTLTGCASGGGRKGQASRLDATLSLLAVLRHIHRVNVPIQRWSEVWTSDVVRAVVQCSRGACARLRAAALHLMAALSYYAQLLPHLLQAVGVDSLSQVAVSVFVLRGEANVVRTAALSLLTAVASRVSSKTNVLECDVLDHLKNSNFLESCLDILVEFCNMVEYKHFIEPNISLSDLERRSEFEVRTQKSGDVRISPLRSQRIRPPPTSALVTAVADALHNISAFTRCPAQEWNDRGLYRLLFRCVSWSKGSREENYKVQTAVTRALFSVTVHKVVRTTLAGTKDCLHNFLATMTALDVDEDNTDCLLSKKQSLFLLAALLPERAAAESVWTYFREVSSDRIFRLLHRCLEIDETELQDAGLYCLTQLLQSAVNNRRTDKPKDDSCIEFYDNMKSPFNHGNVIRNCSGDEGTIDNCQPEYMAEEICKLLLILYHKVCVSTQTYQSSQDDRWVLVSSCLCSVMASSARSRAYAAHRCTPRSVLDSLRAVRDHLSMTGKPADVIRNVTHNPVLRTLYWLLTIINCLMVEYQPAKESFAEDNIAASLNKLWPWCMMTDQLRQAIMNLLHTFTNDCPKAWAAMCACVGGRSLVLECCALTSREAGRTTHSNDHTLLYLGINTIRRCMSHHQCRTIILKSEVLSNMYKMCVRERSRGGIGAGAWVAGVCEAVARHAEGAAAVLTLVGRGAVMALAPRVRAAMMPAIAHAAHHHRVTFLQSPELLELLSGTLLTGDIGEMVSAARAVWALAANNHKAKLLLRSAGVAAAVHSALQKLLRSPPEPASQRALQLLTYTNTVLQAT